MRILQTWALVVFAVLYCDAQQTIPSYRENSLREVLSYIEPTYDVIFTYRDQNVEDHKINIPAGDYQLKNLLELIFDQTDLDFLFIDDKHIIRIKF
jgi:hypothetical protein